MFGGRSTIDIVVITFTFLISIVLIVTVVGAIVGKIIRPNLDTGAVTEFINLMASNIIGALVGFVGGRAVGRQEANGEK